ncbi:MAG: hypothetical protein P8Q23_09955 [Paracoccaceae bacterium]|nr:hypothetical protein [Paracoccaceae bacterium]
MGRYKSESIYTEIKIDAPAQVVWDELTATGVVAWITLGAKLALSRVFR